MSISARHHTFVKERNRWMDFTGLGTTLSTTGRYLKATIIFWLSCVVVTTKWLCCNYRYLRFFPDGQVIMLTTPEDPLSVVPRLRTRNTRYTFSYLARMDAANIKHNFTCWVPTLFGIVEFCFILQNGFSSARSLPSVAGHRQSNQSFCCCL